jgi:hypothetical protein
MSNQDLYSAKMMYFSSTAANKILVYFLCYQGSSRYSKLIIKRSAKSKELLKYGRLYIIGLIL